MSNYSETLDMEENTVGGSLEMFIGIPGPQGPQGEKGEAGEQGEPGAGIAKITQFFATGLDTLHDPTTVYSTECPRLDGVDAKVLWSYFVIEYTDGSLLQTAAHIAGVHGAQGFQGEKGAQGEQGEKGEKGDTGATGARGPQGEKGEAGEQGEKGEKGDQGDRGAQGADGKSAYAYAQDGGYTGSEKNFIADLAAVGGLADELAAL